MAIDTTVFVGSHIRPEANQGQNGDPQAASLLPGEKVKRGTVAKKIMGANVDGVSANAGDWQTRPVTAEQRVATHPGHRSRQHSGSGGETVPSKLNYAGAPAARHPKKK